MLLSSALRQHVGEASADTETAIVGDGAAQGRATWTGYRTGLTDGLTDGRADARAETPRRCSDSNAATDRRVDAVGRRSSPSVAQRSSAGEHGHVANIGAAAD